jgi:hypothetical protein
LLQVYPNGSGASQGTHLSVFLEVRRRRYHILECFVLHLYLIVSIYN